MRYLLALLLLVGCSEKSELDKRIEKSKTRVAYDDPFAPPKDGLLYPPDEFGAPPPTAEDLMRWNKDVEERLDELDGSLNPHSNRVVSPEWAKFEEGIQEAREQILRGEGWMLGVCESMRKCDPEGFEASNCADIIKKYGSEIPKYFE